MAKRICVLYVGGTIGMSSTPSGFVPASVDRPSIERLLQAAKLDTAGLSIVAVGEPLDSADATLDDWTLIAHRIAELYTEHDGFVVLHGTDTMAYTASALSFLLQGLRKPVVLTGAQIPLGQPYSDGFANLTAAINIASNPHLNEVVICFGRHVFRGNRSCKLSTDSFDAFDSPNFPKLAELGRRVIWNHEALLPRPEKERFEIVNYQSGNVVSWRLAPGMDAATLMDILQRAPRALILECYGAGTGPTRDAQLLQAIARAVQDGVVCVAVSQCPWGIVDPKLYASGRALAEAGVIGARDLTFEATFTKLHHLLALELDAATVRQELVAPRCGEVTPKTSSESAVAQTM